MIDEITKDNRSFLKFIKYASQFYKADYYNFENVLYLYENCPQGKAFAKYEDWNGIGRRIKAKEHGYRLLGNNNWSFVVFDISQTWGTPIRFQNFNRNLTDEVVNNLINSYNIDFEDKSSDSRKAFFNTIYNISLKNIAKKNYEFTESEKQFVANTTSLLVLHKCNFYINDLLDENILSNIDKNNYSYLLDTSYFFYKTLMFEVKDLERKLSLNNEEKKVVMKEDTELEKPTPSTQEKYIQPSLFAEENPIDIEFENALKLGNNYEKGEETIYRIITTINDKKSAINELKESFGTGGRTYTFSNGQQGYIDYNAKGITLSVINDISYSYNWNQVYECYERLIANRKFPVLETLQKLENLEKNKDNILNNIYNISNLDECFNLLESVNDNFEIRSIQEQRDIVKEDKQYLEDYYETLQDIQDTTLMLDFLRNQNPELNTFLNNYLDKKQDLIQKEPITEKSMSELLEDIWKRLDLGNISFEVDKDNNIISAKTDDDSFTAKEFYNNLYEELNVYGNLVSAEEMSKIDRDYFRVVNTPNEIDKVAESTLPFEDTEKKVDISKYIGKTYVIKKEDNINSDLFEENDEEDFDIIYKFVGLDEENSGYGLIEDTNVGEIIQEDLDTIISSIDSREKEKNDYINYTARLYVDMLFHSDNIKVDIDKFELNVKRDMEQFCLDNHYKYDEIKDLYDSAVLNMNKIKEGLGTVYSVSDVISTQDGNFIGNYKLTDNEYNDLFNDALDKHIDFVEGLDIEPEEYDDDYDYEDEYEYETQTIDDEPLIENKQQQLDFFSNEFNDNNDTSDIQERNTDISNNNESSTNNSNQNKDYHYRTVEQTLIPTPNGMTLSEKKYKYYDFDGNEIVDYEEKHPPMNNYHIENDFEFGGTKTKFKNNVEAIKLLKTLENENRNATKEEQDILAKYTGWGGIPEAFDKRKTDWADEYLQLKNLLTPDEYDKARESTLTSFYTPNNVIQTMWKIINKFGYKNGNILEPSMGIGNFFGNIPTELENSNLYGIELDSISGRIAKKLYPNADIQINGYQDTNYQDNFFDIAISNIPFGNIPIYDKKYKNSNFLIHDYYFQKTLDKVRAGGIIAFVTSTGTMDKIDNKARKYIAERADLIGAFRLPQNTFKDIANTKVSTDVIFLKKKNKLELNANPSWVDISENEDGIPINNYYIEHPEMLLGNMKFDKSMYGDDKFTALFPFEDKNLNDLLNKVIDNFDTNIYEEVELEDEQKRDKVIPAPPFVKNNSYIVLNDTIYQRNDSILVPLDNQDGKTCERISGMITIRDNLKKVFDIQLRDGTDEELEIAQKDLRTSYDNFVKKYGFLNSPANMRAFIDDPDCYLLSSIEDEYKENDKTLYKKGIVFYQRTLRKPNEILKAENSIEALTISLNEKGFVDIPYIAQLVNKNENEIFEDLDGLIYKEPILSRDRQKDIWVTSAEYLSGNVREKLNQAELLNSDGSLDKNIEALKSVQPKDLTADEIDISLGAVWIPPNIIKQFCIDLVDISWRYEDKLFVDYVPEINSWLLQRSGIRFDYGNIKNTKTWGTSRADALTLIKTSLNLKNISIFDKDDDGKAIFNAKETAIAREKQNEIREEFKNWVNRNDYIKEQLVNIYNKRFNSIRLREYDGSNLEFKGMSTSIQLKEHQKNAVARILFGGNTLLAHTVGAGKTFEMATASMELKRLGIANKPMFVVPNHLTEQWGSEFLRLYPNANILVATKKDFQKNNRKKFMARVATGEWDAVIVGHSSFGKLPVSKELQISHINEEIRNISIAVDRLKAEHDGGLSVKKMEAMQKSLSNNLKKLLSEDTKDDGVTFEELGVDYLFVDEAHEFKNLALFSKMNNVSGISAVASQKASDLYMKIQYLDSLNPNNCVVFATGTPISNSMAELYTMQKYLQFNTLKQLGLDYFDSWASVFGQTVTTIELTPEGGGFRNKTRFAKFNNVPELLTLFKNTADVQTAKTLKLPVPKLKFNKYEIVSAPKSQELTNYIEELVERSELIKNNQVPPYEDNMLKVTNDGRKAALDLRLIDENMPDLPDSKVNIAVNNIAQIYEDTKEQKSTQLVFCDLSTPKSDGSFNVYDDIKTKLILKGVDEKEIAFIHDADTEQKKAELFEDVRNGKIRILLGSTSKMGAGMNVQNKLIALHHLDCPWRPSDIEQREGRILRQGNENEEVQIFRYVTEGSFDGYSYQLIETKANFINQIMTSSTGTRSMEDVDDSALSYAEVKAIATGNPLIIEKFKVENELKQISMLKARYDSSRREMENDLTVHYPMDLKESENTLKLIEQDIPKITDTSGENFSIELLGETFTQRTPASEKFQSLNSILKNEERVLGHISGFEIIGYKDDLINLPHFYLKGAYKYPIETSSNTLGNILKIENVLKGITNRRDIEEEKIKKINNQIEQTKEELQKPFNKEQELKELLNRKSEIYKELGINEDDEQIICEVEENTKQFDMEL